MSRDDFSQRIAGVRERFAARLGGSLSAIDAALPTMVGEGAEVAGAVFNTHRTVHDLCGLGPTLGFDAVGKAARVMERVLLQPSRERRGLTGEEMAQVRESFGGLRMAAQAELQSADLGATMSGARRFIVALAVVSCGWALPPGTSHAQTATRLIIQPPPRPQSVPSPTVQPQTLRQQLRGADLVPTALKNASQPAPPTTEQPAPAEQARPVVTRISFADIGFTDGFRFANLGGRREVFLPVPQGARVQARELVLTIDDVSAHDAKRHLEVQINDRSAAAIALDGQGSTRTVRISLGGAEPRDGFLKLTFTYSGAATQDRCIDVRYVGDSLTVRPSTAVELEIAFAGVPDVATVAALMPRDVMVALPRRRLTEEELAAALTVARAAAAAGHRVSFQSGLDALPQLAHGDGEGRWSRGVIVVASLPEVWNYLDAPVASVAGPIPTLGSLTAARVGGVPLLIVSDPSAIRAGRFLGSANIAAARGLSSARVGEFARPQLPLTQVTFDQLGILPVAVDVFGRAALKAAVDTRNLPAGTRPARLILDVMVAPDSAGERAVVSVFVNDRLLNSSVAAVEEPTRIDLPLPAGLVGAIANVEALVQRRSAQGDCRYEPQGYPAQILASSTVVLESTAATAVDFSDLIPRWSDGINVQVPFAAADRPEGYLPLLADVLDALAPEAAPITVNFTTPGRPPAPTAPFIAVSDVPPAGATPRVRFDRGQVAVADRNGRVLLDLGGFESGAVLQVVNAGGQDGLWIRPLAADGMLPSPPRAQVDRGDVAFVDRSGVALAMSTERDTLLRITYPDKESWLTVADRYRSWVIGGLWVFGSVAFLFLLQQMRRRRPSKGE